MTTIKRLSNGKYDYWSCNNGVIYLIKFPEGYVHDGSAIGEEWGEFSEIVRHDMSNMNLEEADSYCDEWNIGYSNEVEDTSEEESEGESKDE